MFTFIKFGKREHLDRMRDDGLLYMQTVRYFRKLERDAVRGDPDEGVAHALNSTFIQWMELRFEDGTILRPEPRGLVNMSYDEGLKHNLFCMYGLNERSLHVDPRVAEFGPWALFFTDASEFLRRAKEALGALQYRAAMQPVEYVDREWHHGEVGPFRKYKEYEYQSEYRILVRSGVGEPLEVKLGSLADICDITPSATINDLIQLEHNLLPASTSAA